MPENQTQTLTDEFKKLHTEATAVVVKAKEENRSLSAEEREANDKRFDRMQAIKTIAEDEKRLAEMAFEQNKDLFQKIAQPQISPALDKPTLPPAEQFTRVRDEVNQFLRTGAPGRDQFTLITTSGSSVMLPSIPTAPWLTRKPLNAIRLALAARGLQPIVTAGTENVPVPVFDDSSNDGDQPAENATTENPADPTVTSKALGAGLFSSQSLWFSNSLIMANSFDILSYVEPQLSQRVDHKQQAVYTAKLTADSTIVGATTASATAATYPEILNWIYSLPVQYRSDGVLMMSDGLWRLLAGLVDSQNRPIFVPSISESVPTTLLGYPAFVDDALATPAANTISGVFASARALLLRDVSNRRMTRYVNIPTRPDQTGLEIFVNGDFNYVGVGVKTLKFGAS